MNKIGHFYKIGTSESLEEHSCDWFMRLDSGLSLQNKVYTY